MTDRDPWAHRSENMRCRTCMWFVPKDNEVLDGNVVGRCRRGAPTMDGYPVVFEHDWCGKHKLVGQPAEDLLPLYPEVEIEEEPEPERPF